MEQHRGVGSLSLATFAEVPRDTADLRGIDLTHVCDPYRDDARIDRPGRFPSGRISTAPETASARRPLRRACDSDHSESFARLVIRS
jgi:hypothetical protein